MGRRQELAGQINVATNTGQDTVIIIHTFEEKDFCERYLKGVYKTWHPAKDIKIEFKMEHTGTIEPFI